MKVSRVAPSGQRRRGAIEHGPIAARETAFEPNPLIGQAGDGGAQRAPALFVGKQRRAKQGHMVDMRPVAELAWIDRPHAGKGRIEQFKAAVAAKHGDALLQGIEGFALHADRGVDTGKRDDNVR